MSLPKQLYDTYKLILGCDLVQNKNVTKESIDRFETLLNEAIPANDTPLSAQMALVRMMYHSNKNGFIRYISNYYNHVSALILWTESKRIVKFFDLLNVVHIRWDNDNHKYVVSKYDKKQTNNKTSDVVQE